MTWTILRLDGTVLARGLSLAAAFDAMRAELARDVSARFTMRVGGAS